MKLGYIRFAEAKNCVINLYGHYLLAQNWNRVILLWYPSRYVYNKPTARKSIQDRLLPQAGPEDSEWFPVGIGCLPQQKLFQKQQQGQP